MRGKKIKFNWFAKSTLTILFISVIFLALFATNAPRASASFLDLIPFSATMLNSNGSEVSDGSYQIRFRFYSNLTGGSPLWQETQTVATENGKFETMLGSIAILSALNFDQTLFVSVQVEDDNEMSPRKQVGATPQALMAKRATSLVAPDGGSIEALGTLHVSEGLHVEGETILDGALIFKEGSAVSATAGYGKLYTSSSDHTLHFVDSTGADSTILSTGSSLKVQELVKDFTADAGENIVAGNLVTYLNGKVRKGATQNLSAPSVFESSATANISAVALSSDKIAISYSDLGNSNFGTTIVGTINGSSIAWGTASVFEAASTYNAETPNISPDPPTPPNPPLNISMVALTSNKIAVSYTDTDNSNYGTTIIGTISGTDISWGTASVFRSASANFISAVPLASDKIAVSFADISNSNYGTTIIGTISGTDISWGTASVFEAASTNFISAVSLSSDKIAVSYADIDNSYFGTTIIGTISGTTISWGTASVFEPVNTSNISSTALSADKIAIVYSDISNAEHGSAIIGKVSGTSLSFGTVSEFNPSSTYDPDYTFIANSAVVALSSDKIVVSYQDHFSSKGGTTMVGHVSDLNISWSKKIAFKNYRSEFISAIVLSPDKVAIGYQDFGNSSFGTVVTSSMLSFTGVSKNACVSGQTCNVSIKGVVSGLASLSPGTVYYTGANGILTTTPYPNRVGTAISTTEILLDGKWDDGDTMVSDLIFKNSFRLTELQNSNGLQGLAMYDQNTKPLLQLTDSGKLAVLSFSVGPSFIGSAAPANGLIVEGDVGIGLSSPTAKLHIKGSAGSVGIELSSNETTALNNILVLRSDVGTDDNPVFRVQADGAVYADGAYTGTGADYAEYFPNEEVIAPGSLVGLNKDSGRVRKYVEGDQLIGVVSASAGFIGNGTEETQNDADYTLVGLLGQVQIDPDQIRLVDGTAFTQDGVQVGHSLLGGKILLDIVKQDARVSKLMLSFDQDGALTLGAGSRLFYKSDGLLAVEGSLELLKDIIVKGKFITPSASVQYLTAIAKISATSTKVKISGKDEAVALTGEQIETGEDGQNIIIQGSDDIYSVTLQSPVLIPNSKAQLGAESRVMGKGDILTLTYDATDGLWYEVSYTDN